MEGGGEPEHSGLTLGLAVAWGLAPDPWGRASCTLVPGPLHPWVLP